MSLLFRLMLLFLLIIPLEWVTAQTNDDCSNAILLNDVVNYCSEYAEFNNIKATPSGIPETICIPNELTARDVWFSFIAVNNFLNIRVTGAEPGNMNGTLTSPQLTIYSGDCNNLTEITCSSDAFDKNFVELSIGPLTLGQKYFICISARNDAVGTFQLCLNNYNLTFTPKSDCPDSRVLCDKSAVLIEHVTGQGIDQNELPAGTCLRKETSSSWFRWTCKTSGTLTFTLTPIQSEDDIDFGLFELPGGIDDCAGKKMIRCEAAGENVGEPISNWIQCTGATGLRLTSNDTNEDPGCQNGNDNWVKYIDMVQGKSYSLLVNNYSNSGQGYFLEFGGTGTFLGAEAFFDILPETQCYEDSLLFTDVSLQPTDKIISWDWNFGKNVNPNTYSGSNPPKIKYDRPGYKSILLTIHSEEGCVNTQRKTILMRCCIDPLEVKIEADPLTVDLGNSIDLNAITLNAIGNVTYSWTPENILTGCFDCPSTSALPLRDITFTILTQDEKGCTSEDTLSIRVENNYKIFVPNVFTPNHDGTNDRFTIFTNQAAKSVRKLLIFNRWGACVYEGYDFPPNDEHYGWDGYFKGQKCNPGVFAFYTIVEFLNGETIVKKGSITLID